MLLKSSKRKKSCYEYHNSSEQIEKLINEIWKFLKYWNYFYLFKFQQFFKIKNVQFISMFLYICWPVYKIDSFDKSVVLINVYNHWTFLNGSNQAFFHKQVDLYMKKGSDRQIIIISIKYSEVNKSKIVYKEKYELYRD